MYRILVADDEPLIREMIKKYAQFEGHETIEADTGLKVVELCNKIDFDIILLDVMMPELDGFSVCRAIRKNKQTPIIMISARGEEYDRIHGFEAGADDYVVKPFSPKELMMRIDAIIRRSGNSVKKDVFERNGLCIDFTARKVSVSGKEVDLTPKEYDLLFYLVKNKGIALSRDKLITEVWGYDYFGDDRTLDTHIKMLRKNLGEFSETIVTLRGMGYRFDEPERKKQN